MDLLIESIIYLTAAIIAVPISKRLGFGSVLGYLAAGILIGPFGIALIDDAEHMLHFAELGVVFVLFIIGLVFWLGFHFRQAGIEAKEMTADEEAARNPERLTRVFADEAKE